MPRICYTDKRFSTSNQDLIAKADQVAQEYAVQGFILTARQLYYVFVSRDWIPNTKKTYKHLTHIVSEARLAGLLDWNHFEDRRRNLHSLPDWNSPSELVSACSDQFRFDKWQDQKYRPEVWIEKEALAGVFTRVCDSLQVPMFACVGYTSQSEMWGAAQRLKSYARGGQTPIIFHFGDHDPSGIDMTRDIVDRMSTFRLDLDVDRLALNMNQVEQYNPPPNPAKVTDSRYEAYMTKFGDESWELDALEPRVLEALVRTAIDRIRGKKKWKVWEQAEEEARRLLGAVADKWSRITRRL